jgi:protein-L-isoaspartate(D-aspartate) O-methyltransferase
MQDTGVVDSLANPLHDTALFRRTMVDCQIKTFDVTDPALLARLLEIPRELFLPAELAPLAYSDAALQVRPGEAGKAARTLLPPLILARLIQGAEVLASDNVLDVASATGYSAALLAGLAGTVVALESDPALFKQTRSNLDAFGLTQVRLVLAPLAAGAPNEAPFDVIFVNGGVDANLTQLFAQLKEGGRLLAIQRLPDGQTGWASKAVRYEKVDGVTGYRILFDAWGPVLDEFRRGDRFTFP